MEQVIGPFTQIVTFKQTALKGPLQASDMGIVEDAGVRVIRGLLLKLALLSAW